MAERFLYFSYPGETAANAQTLGEHVESIIKNADTPENVAGDGGLKSRVCVLEGRLEALIGVLNTVLDQLPHDSIQRIAEELGLEEEWL